MSPACSVTLTVTVVVVVVVVCWRRRRRCCYPFNFFLSLVVAKNCQIGCIFTFLWNSRSKKHRNTDQCFLQLGSPKHPKTTVFTCFLLLVAKITVFTVLFGQHLLLRSFQHVARSRFSMPKRQKHCKWQCFGQKQTAKVHKKLPKMDLPNPAMQASFYPCCAAQKRENTTRVKDLGGGSVVTGCNAAAMCRVPSNGQLPRHCRI